MAALAFLGTVSSISAQGPAAGSETSAADSIEKTISPSIPAATESNGTAQGSVRVQLPAREAIQARLEEAAAAANPDDADSEMVVSLYQEALTLYDSIQTERKLHDSFAELLTSAPRKTREAIAALEAIPAVPAKESAGDQPPPGLTKDSSVDQINDRLNAERVSELAAKKKLESLEEDLSVQQTRPDKIRDRSAEIRESIAEAEAVMAALAEKPATTEVDDASLLKTRIQIEALEAELAALEQEQLSYDVRLALTEAERDLASQLALLAEAETVAIQAFADSHLKDSADDAVALAEETRTETEDGPEVVRGIADEITKLASEFEEVNQRIATVSDKAKETEASLNDLRRQYDELRTQLEIGGMREAQGELLLNQRRLMPNHRVIKADLSELRESTSEIRLHLFRIQSQLRDAPEAVAEQLVKEMEPSPTGADFSGITEELVPLITKRNELLKELSGLYRRLLAEEGEYDEALHELATLTAEAREFLNEKLIWVRSSEPVSLSTFAEIPGGVAWLFDPDGFRELIAALRSLRERSPALVLSVVVVFLVLILTRSRCKRRITEFGHKVQKISTDRYQFTFSAFLLTVSLALPFPILLALAGWGLVKAPDPSDWLLGLGDGLLMSAYLLWVVLLVRAVCREEGLGEQHFRWRRVPLKSVRENVTWISLLYIPMIVIAWMTLKEDESIHLASIGRLSFVAVMLWSAFFLRRMFDEQTGVMSLIIRDHPQEFVARLQKFWVFIFVSFPIAMGIIALAGYTLTGFSLIRQFRLTIEFIGLGVIVYAMILRWFSMRERKLILQQRLQERRERAEAEVREAEGIATSTSDEGGLPDFDENSIDFDEVGEQTRRLLRFAVGSGVALAIWLGWADVVPAMRGLDSIKILGGISLGALIPAVFILIMTTIGAKNLPGLLEIGVLRHLPLDAGLRYAITSLCQYIVVAVGISMAFGVLGVDWSKLGWIAAALSVGLGFGLQEIVANFVCGIILLFERPIRVGDVVTVSGTTGVVSKIRIRATTILDRDQKEFIVPNKEFITGSILNWTLSTTLNRIVILVGVAYGSDTRRARDLLLEICNAHPDVLKDPATSVVFDAFGDSTLNFTVRTYLASMENRLGVTNDLHHEIHERFEAEGIEIAFPQMDLHLRSVDPGVNLGSGTNTEPPKA